MTNRVLGLVVLLPLVFGGLFAVPGLHQGVDSHLTAERLTLIGPQGNALMTLDATSGVPTLHMKDSSGRVLIRMGSEVGSVPGTGSHPAGEIIVRKQFEAPLDEVGTLCRVLGNGLTLEPIEGAEWSEAHLAIRPGLIKISDDASGSEFYASPWVCRMYGPGGLERLALQKEGLVVSDKKGKERVMIFSEDGVIQTVTGEGKQHRFPQ